MFVEKINEAQELLANDGNLKKVEIRFSIETNKYGSVFRNFDLVISRDKYTDNGVGYYLCETGMFGNYMGNVEMMKNGTGFYVSKVWFGQIMKQKMKFEDFTFKKIVSIAGVVEKQEPISEEETAKLPF
tara:strand:+ start:208 stop:594 length:387 start_codon:yes stop_codon:yes gene_type:complete